MAQKEFKVGNFEKLFNSRWHISTNANTSKIFWPQLFIGSGCSPMKTGFRGTQLGHPRPPWGGLGGPESQKWAIWGANENKLSWLFFIRNEILSLAPNYTLGPVKILVKKDFWSGSFPVRQAQNPRFSLGSVKVAKYFLPEFKWAFTMMNLLSTTGANTKIDFGR